MGWPSCASAGASVSIVRKPPNSVNRVCVHLHLPPHCPGNSWGDGNRRLTSMGMLCSVLFVQYPLCFCALVMRMGDISLSLSFEHYFRDNKLNIWCLYLRGQRWNCLWQGDESHARKNQASFLNPSLQLPPRHKHHIPFSVSKTNSAKTLLPILMNTISACRKAS